MNFTKENNGSLRWGINGLLTLELCILPPGQFYRRFRIDSLSETGCWRAQPCSYDAITYLYALRRLSKQKLHRHTSQETPFKCDPPESFDQEASLTRRAIYDPHSVVSPFFQTPGYTSQRHCLRTGRLRDTIKNNRFTPALLRTLKRCRTLRLF